MIAFYLVVNISTLCRSLGKPHMEAELSSLPGAVEVKGNRHPRVNGFWVHLSLVAAKAELLEMPEDLRRLWLDPKLAGHVSLLQIAE